MNNAERWENATVDMKGNRKIHQATLFLNNIHTQYYHGLTKPLRKMDSNYLHLSLHLQAQDLNIISDQQTEKPES